MKKLRAHLIKLGLIKPKNLKEIREHFTFPYEANQTPPKPLNYWASRHIIKQQSQYH